MIGERVYTENRRTKFGTVVEYDPTGFNHWIVKWDDDDGRERIYGAELRHLDPDSDPTLIKDLTRWHLERCLVAMDALRVNYCPATWKWDDDDPYVLARNYLHNLDQGNV